MATTRPTTVRRVEHYLGPDKEIRADALDEFERSGEWLMQPKIDGMWAMLTVGCPAEGRPHVLKSRDARTGPVSGAGAGDLLEAALPFPEGTIIVGELESASQWATDQFAKHGHRRMHLFDVVHHPGRIVADLRDMSTENRYAVLVEMFEELRTDPALAARFPLVQSYRADFKLLYTEWVLEGLEGCVIKKLESSYRTTRQDGKTNEWLRCKKFVTEDYVLLGFAMTPGGKAGKPQKTGCWGLWDEKKAKWVECLRSGTNDNETLLTDDNVGKLVSEFRGWERFRSGAVRHAQFVRIRPEKQPGECVLKGIP